MFTCCFQKVTVTLCYDFMQHEARCIAAIDSYQQFWRKHRKKLFTSGHKTSGDIHVANNIELNTTLFWKKWRTTLYHLLHLREIRTQSLSTTNEESTSSCEKQNMRVTSPGVCLEGARFHETKKRKEILLLFVCNTNAPNPHTRLPRDLTRHASF